MVSTLRGTAAVRSLGGGRLVGQHEYERRAGSVGLARLLVEDVLVEHGVEERRLLDAAILLTSELTTDAVRHGAGETFLVAITVGGRQVQVNVTSAVEDEAAAPSGPGAAAVDGAPDGPPAERAGAACVAVPFRGEGRLVALPAPAVQHPVPDIAEHSRAVVDILASSWDVRQSATERTAWFCLDR